MSERIHAFGENGELSDGAELALDHFMTTEVNPAISAAVSQVSGGTTDHAALTNRDAVDQHPIGAITNLWTTLAGKAETSHTHGAGDLTGVVKTVNGEAPDSAGDVVVESTVLRHPAIVVHKNTGSGGRRWVHTFPMGWDAYATTSGTNNMNIWPLGLPQTLDVVAASVKVNTAAEAAALRVGIYADDGARGPGTRLLDLTFSLEETGVVTVAGLSVTLPAGDYWVAVIGSTGTGRVQGSRPADYSVNSSSHGTVPFAYQRGGIKAVSMPTSAQLANLDLYTGSWIRDDNSTAAMPNLALEYLL